ncbi:MAG: helix-turn-helix transcriptional regulator [Caulobacteraceae bacterium]|nr:helix-turn-helix transcriptional regulator [Caulobacteraceae bacterium]
MDENELVDGIYDAAVTPDLWPTVLGRLAGESDSQWAVLVTRRNDAWVDWRVSPNVPDSVHSYLRSDAARRSETTPRLLRFGRPGFVAEHEVFDDDEFLADPYMAEWSAREGFHHAAATAIQAPNGDFAVVQVTRRFGEGKYSQTNLSGLDRFRPHLARAAILAARWKMERLRAAAEALALIGLPAAVVDADCRVVIANYLVEQLEAHVVWLPRNGLALKDRPATAALRRAVAAIARDGCKAARSLPARSGAGVEPVVAHVVPLRGHGRDLFDGGYALLVLTVVKDAPKVDAAVIQGLFDLTAAESQVAARVARGWTVDAIARRHGVGRETIRSQLRSVLSKTGTARQAELAAKLGALRKTF